MTAWQTIVNLPLDILTGYIKEQSDSLGLKEWIRIYTLAFSLCFSMERVARGKLKTSFCVRSHSWVQWAQLCEEIFGHSGAYLELECKGTFEDRSCSISVCIFLLRWDKIKLFIDYLFFLKRYWGFDWWYWTVLKT